ncbi:glycoside hydrolase family 9 protein, partial [candidate division KSB1 bacterium]|nr:glycoside hydrolase family 9 protein [candidate division KSB1 bacterium]
MNKNIFFLAILAFISGITTTSLAGNFTLNELGYFEKPGVDVMVFHDFYPEGHQGGVTIVQNGERTAANGDLRLDPTPGQWQPIPKLFERTEDRAGSSIRVRLVYPDSSRDKKGFNPIDYPDIHFAYTVKVKSMNESVFITVDLDRPLPEAWCEKVGFNLELFPGLLFGTTFYMENKPGIFPRQLNGPMDRDKNGELQITPLATGNRLVIAPENSDRRMEIQSSGAPLQLYDGRAFHNNGWFVVRSTILPGTTQNAIQWVIEPHAQPGWMYTPVVHISQVGYLPQQPKIAVIETDPDDQENFPVRLIKILSSGDREIIKTQNPESWGRFLRFQYYKFDFSAVIDSGIYIIDYGESRSNPFLISPQVFCRHVWQPTLETFLPVQMCHMRVNDRYRVWHGLCHMDDALMAPTDLNHFDGYSQGSSTLTKYKPLEPVPGLNMGGWHDAGDFDLRVESQAGTVRILALAYEEFGIQYDETTIDQHNHLVELHRPDGKPDILQQIEHGVLTILAGYKNLGRLYRGIICQDLRQYVLLGDGAAMTDNIVYNPNQTPETPRDDRLVFTEENPSRELEVAAALAAASRVLVNYNPDISQECLAVAEILWESNSDKDSRNKISAAAELLLTTQKPVYKSELQELLTAIDRRFAREGWCLGRIKTQLNDKFSQDLDSAAEKYA